MIKYRYALDQNDNIVDIQDLNQSNLSKNDIFYSLDFKQIVIPRLGLIRVKHFSHKPNTKLLGSSETYLHALGKKVFINEYNKCLLMGLPFFITYTTSKICNRLENLYNIKCHLGSERNKFDLASYFNKIILEKKDDNFIPDLLLLNTNTKEKIYIEITVTHSSSVAKLNSGYRIIEIPISDENDINKILKLKDGIYDNSIKFINFKSNKKIGSFCSTGKCIHKEFIIFNVSSNGKCNMKIIEENEIQIYIKKHSNTSIWQVLVPDEEYIEVINYYNVESEYGEIYKRFVRLAYSKNIKVRNCFICRYHSINFSPFSDEGAIFCKFTKISCSSNNAVQCNYFKADFKV